MQSNFQRLRPIARFRVAVIAVIVAIRYAQWIDTAYDWVLELTEFATVRAAGLRYVQYFPENDERRRDIISILDARERSLNSLLYHFPRTIASSVLAIFLRRRQRVQAVIMPRGT